MPELEVPVRTSNMRPVANTTTEKPVAQEPKKDLSKQIGHAFPAICWAVVAICVVTGLLGVLAGSSYCVLAACAAWVAVASLDVWQTLSGWRNILAIIMMTGRWAAILGISVLVGAVGYWMPGLAPVLYAALFFALLWKVFGSTSGEVETATLYQKDRLYDIESRCAPDHADE